MGWDRFFAECRRRGGVVRLAPTARSAGLAVRTVQRRARVEGWWWPYPDVVAPPGTVPDAVVRCRAAILSLTRRPGTAGTVAITRRHALLLHGIRTEAPRRVAVVVPASRHPEPGPQLEVIRSRDLRAADVVERDGIPVVGGARVARDLAATCDLRELRSVVIDLIQQRRTTLAEVADLHRRTDRFPGRGRLGEVIDQLDEAGRTDSPLELTVRRRLAADGIALDRGQVAVEVPGGRVLHLDLGIAAIRFGIEVESMLAHSGRRELELDVVRANAIAARVEGWCILRVTWSTVEDRWPTFLAQVRTVVTERSRRHLGRDRPHPDDLRT